MTTSSPPPPGRPVDWSLGRYEHIAGQLLPAARAVIERAAPAAGERVVDVGCGTGNASLLAAERGASVTGVDPAPRLLEVARKLAQAQGLDATFASGDAAGLPLEDGAADLVLSVFGVIFAPDPAAAVAEMARVTAPGGRIVISAWVPEGAVSDAVRVAAAAVRRVTGAPTGRAPFAWHDRDRLATVLAPHGFEVTVAAERLAFTAKSAGEYVDAQAATHPLSVAARAALEASGALEALRERTLSIYEDANEDPNGFRVTSRYVVATAWR